MKHYRENSTSKTARVRVSLDMLPKAVQRSGKDKQLDVLKKMFKRACGAYGILREIKEREFYVKPGEKKRKEAKYKKAVARGEIQEQQNFYEKDTKYFDEFNF